MNIDFSTLPAPQVVEPLAYEAVLAAMLADLRARDTAFTALVESDPAFKILEVAAYRETLLRARVNDAAKSVLLAHATAADLDNLAAFYGVRRKVIRPADDTTIPPTPALLEADGDLRRRVLLSLDGFSTAGAKNAYIFHALNVAGVKDVSVMSAPQTAAAHPAANGADAIPAGVIAPGQVYVFLQPDGTRTLAAVALDAKAALNAENVRPLTDQVSVAFATAQPVTVTAQLFIYPGPDAEIVRAAALANLEKYAADISRIGRDVTHSALTAALFVSGVHHIEFSSPTGSITIPPDEYPVVTIGDITIGGTAE